ncbi:maleylpyruvate isomerase family mycothiol-dependent enzyme [Chitinophaga lutea]
MNNIPIDVAGLLPVLDERLLSLLKSLQPEDWNRQTVARLWKVKDVAAHLLDGNIRGLSILRDGYFGERPDGDLLSFLNRLNADWVQAMKRVSPSMLILLLEATGKPFCDYFRTLDPMGISPLAVDWAGESESFNWMETAREYTEKWLHQQQIRDALGDTGLMTRELFYPFIDIFMRALPHTFRSVAAEDGTTVRLSVSTAIGGDWFLSRMEGRWALTGQTARPATTMVSIDPDSAWKLFSKSWRLPDVAGKVTIDGDQRLGETALGMVSVMA